MLRNKRVLLGITILMIVAMVVSGCARGKALAKEINMNQNISTESANL